MHLVTSYSYYNPIANATIQPALHSSAEGLSSNKFVQCANNTFMNVKTQPIKTALVAIDAAVSGAQHWMVEIKLQVKYMRQV